MDIYCTRACAGGPQATAGPRLGAWEAPRFYNRHAGRKGLRSSPGACVVRTTSDGEASTCGSGEGSSGLGCVGRVQASLQLGKLGGSSCQSRSAEGRRTSGVRGSIPSEARSWVDGRARGWGGSSLGLRAFGIPSVNRTVVFCLVGLRWRLLPPVRPLRPSAAYRPRESCALTGPARAGCKNNSKDDGLPDCVAPLWGVHGHTHDSGRVLEGGLCSCEGGPCPHGTRGLSRASRVSGRWHHPLGTVRSSWLELIARCALAVPRCGECGI